MLELWWLGQSGSRLRDPAGGPTVFCDPFLTVGDNRTWQAPIDATTLARQADLVLVSHEHTDHLDRPALEAAAQAPGSHFTVVLPRPLLSEAEALGLTADRIVGAQPEEAIEHLGVSVHPVPACHGVDVVDAYSFGERFQMASFATSATWSRWAAFVCTTPATVAPTPVKSS